MGKNKKVVINSFENLYKLNVGEEEVKEVPENNKNNEDYANAPYNFIEFPDRVVYRYDNIDDLPKHNIFRDDLNTGYIEYNLENLNPLFIGSGKGQTDEFFKSKDKDGKDMFVIPGSTMRGKVRSNAEVLSFSYPQFVEDRKFLYRDIAGETISKDEYYERLDLNGDSIDISDKVEAGYLYQKNGKYYIKPAKKIRFIFEKNKEKEKSFFKISELKLRLNDIRTKYMYQENVDLIKKIKDNKSDEQFQIFKEEYYSRERKDINSFAYSNYEFRRTFIKFNILDNGGLGQISWNYKINYNYNGYLYNSEWIKDKKNHYVINEPDELAKIIEITDKQIFQYEKDYKDNKIKNSFYYLPKENEEKVFFYKIENDNIKYFGRTPYLRMFYENSIKEIKNNHILNSEDIYDENNRNLKYKIDYSEALFGFTNKNLNIKKEDETVSYKGRVNFGDLQKKEGELMDLLPEYNQNLKSKDFVLSNPKPTSFQLYLKQDRLNNKKLTTYNNPNNKDVEENKKRIEPELRGQKFYWQRNNIVNTREAKSFNMRKNFKALEKNQIFKGKIHFENLADDELGLLLLSLKYDENTKDSIGMAKPYGYGKIDIKGIKLVIEKKKESFQNFFNEKFDKSKSIEDYKKDFKNKFLEIYGNGKEVDTSKYEKMKIIDQYKMSKKNYKGKEELRYMGIKEFSDRKPLKDINDYIGSD